MPSWLLLFLACALVWTQYVGGTAPKLGSFNVNTAEGGPTSVSGLSSGAYFATQMQVAFSSTISGAGIFAGGPYNCAQGSETTALTSCMTALPPPSVQKCISTTDSRSAAGTIDDTANLKTQKVYMFSGTQDTTVKPAVMEALYDYYSNYIPSSSISFMSTLKAAHTQPTIDRSENPCTISMSPYISYCEYDGAGIALDWIYGPLNPRINGTLSGAVYEFDQSEFYEGSLNGISMAATGYVYVPKACDNGDECILHVSFHGCEQDYNSVKDAYIQHAGYNEWADANRMIVLYPQTTASQSAGNPNACWDWWGYEPGSTNNYDTQEGAQMKMIKAMMDRIGSNFNPIDSPTDLKAGAITEDSIELSWAAVEGAVAYNVYRGASPLSDGTGLTSTDFTDTDLQSGTTYTYTVTAVADSGGESAQSEPLSATTAGDPPPLSPPTGLACVSQEGDALVFSWDSVPQADGYNFYRDGAKVNPAPLSATEYRDEGLTASTTYTDYVTSLQGSVESGPSESVACTTTDGYVCTEYYDNNYDHVQKGRAHTTGGYVYANGSDDVMGLYNVATYSNLAETSEGYYIVGSCPQARTAD